MVDIKRVLPDEFDSAIIGTVNDSMCAVYSLTKIIKCLVKHRQMDFIEAKEWFEYNEQSKFDQSDDSIYVDDLHFIM